MSEINVNARTKVAVGVQVERVTAIARIIEFAAEVLRVESLKHYVDEGIRKRQWIAKIVFYYRNSDGEVERELELKIDWEKHQIHLANGKQAITIAKHSGVVADLAPEFGAALNAFKRLSDRQDAEIRYTLGHVATVNREVYMKELGLVDSNLKYAGEQLRHSIEVRQLDELSIEERVYGKSAAKSVPPWTVKGTVVKVGDHYGFLRPKDHEGKKDYYFLLKEWPQGGCKLGMEATFEAYISEDGKHRAKKIQPK